MGRFDSYPLRQICPADCQELAEAETASEWPWLVAEPANETLGHRGWFAEHQLSRNDSIQGSARVLRAVFGVAPKTV